MRQETATYFFPGVFAPTLSLNALSERREPDGSPSFDIPDDEALTPDEQAAQFELHAAVDAFVGKLDERDRFILIRLFWHSDTQTRVAADLGVSKMAVCKAVARIYELGRQFLAPHSDFTSIH